MSSKWQQPAAGSKSGQSANNFRYQKANEYQECRSGIMPNDVLGASILASPPITPTLSVEINTMEFLQLIKKVSMVLNQLKLPSLSEYSNELILLAAFCYQLEAKLVFSRVNSSFVDAYDVISQAERTRNILDRALLPIAIALDQIGTFELDGQRFIPVPTAPNLCASFVTHHSLTEFPNLFSGDINQPFERSYSDIPVLAKDGKRLRVRIKDQGRQILAQQGGIIEIEIYNIHMRVLDSNNFIIAPGFFFMIEDPKISMVVETVIEDKTGFITFAQLAPMYIQLIGQIEYKYKGAVVDLNLGNGLGSPSQLVGYHRVIRKNASDPDAECVVTCSRIVPTQCLMFGGALKLGLTSHALHVEGIEVMRAHLDTANVLTNMAMSLMKTSKR